MQMNANGNAGTPRNTFANSHSIHDGLPTETGRDSKLRS